MVVVINFEKLIGGCSGFGSTRDTGSSHDHIGYQEASWHAYELVMLFFFFPFFNNSRVYMHDVFGHVLLLFVSYRKGRK